jgi:hypothetical protein
MTRSRTPTTLAPGKKQGDLPGLRSDGAGACEHAMKQANLEAKKSELLGRLARPQRMFLLEKLVGLNDKNAGLAAGYSLSVAESTEQRIWTPDVRQDN